MIKSIKTLKELNKKANRMVNRVIDDEGLEVISMKVLNDDNFLSPYSTEYDEIISDEVATYLEHVITPIDLKHELHLVISSNCITEEEKEIYKKAIKNYYKDKVIDSARKIHINSIQSFWMLLTGIVIMIAYFILQFFFDTPFLEVMDIATWVFVWEAVDLFFIERKILKIQQLRDTKLFNAKVSYRDLK